MVSANAKKERKGRREGRGGRGFKGSPKRGFFVFDEARASTPLPYDEDTTPRFDARGELYR